MVHAAEKVSDLAGQSNSLEALRGDREGNMLSATSTPVLGMVRGFGTFRKPTKR